MSHPSPSLLAFLALDMNTPIPPSDLEPILASPPFIPLPSFLNLRDLGLLPSSPVPPGLVYRSGAIHSIPTASLGTLNLSMILDLRSARERTANPTSEIPGVENVWVAGDRKPKALEMGGFMEDGGVEGYREMYMDILEVYKSSFRTCLNWIIHDRKGRGGMLFHCTAGKDRTGVLSALLLSLAGAPRSLIAFDYALTRIGVEPSREVLTQMLKLWNKDWTDETPGMKEFVQVKDDFILAMLDAVEEEYGGVEGYVRAQLGFGVDEVGELKKVLRRTSVL
ncbi:protein-tyrosine phosphatase-like protein [Phaeosphaeria sp. MPI-PUGE-AT-0046c]|nr:protein-tyrosine phosphatase-like protein [Phaeosphaeria sp. MPI-PUGE-AT-0046c]